MTIELDATVRLDYNCTGAPEDDPLCIDIYDGDGDFSITLHSFSVRGLIEEMIRSRTNITNGRLVALGDTDDIDKPDPLVLIRDELIKLAKRIDEALSTRDGAGS